MENNYNYSYNFNTNRGYDRSYTGSSARTNSPTQRQIGYYMDLCVQRKVTPKNYTQMTADQLAQEIETLRKFYPASQKQIDMIRDKVTNLQGMGININMPSDVELNALTGGQGGTASVMIESLIKLERQHSDQAPPTEAQLKFLVEMYLCPDVPFEENFDIRRRIELDNNMWRRPTPDEFAEQIKTKMKRNDASRFIDQHRGAFHTWKQTRIRPEQMRYIKELEARMVNLGSPVTVEYSIDINGNITQVQKHDTDKSAQYNPKGYMPLDDMQLMMMSSNEASQYIDILKSEQGRRELYSYGEVSDNSATFEDLRQAKDEHQAKIQEFTALQDLIFKLEAVAGYENPEVHDAVNFYLVEEGGNAEAVRESRKVIKDFMLYLVQNEYIAFSSIAELCKDSKVAQNILIGV